jgi:putative nucleotidyltransferase with HDIG domain
MYNNVMGKLIAKINASSFNQRQAINHLYRFAARAIVLDYRGRIGLLHVTKYNYYKLPGGGIDKGEDIKQALKRECLEELGCEIEILDFMGDTLEFRPKFKMKQTSHCFVACVKGEKGEPKFTKKERHHGFVVLWEDPRVAMELIKQGESTAYEAKFIIPRDLAILKSFLDYEQKRHLTKYQHQALVKILQNNFENYQTNWNYWHTLKVVEYAKRLAIAEKANSKILMSAAYLHDIGYAKLLPLRYDLSQRKAAKKEHMKLGADFTKKVLPKINFSNCEIWRVSHLVGIHDEVEKIKTHDEQIIMEADSLAMLTPLKVESDFSLADRIKFFEKFKNSRAIRFKTKLGKKLLNELIPKYEKNLKN